MIGGNTVLAVVPARGGSKALPGKNVRELGGKPLLAWTIEAAQGSRYIDRLILSSDDAEIIAVAREWGCEAPFVRPAALATDEAGSMGVVQHALEAVEEDFDYLVLLQPTSPLRAVEDIDGCIERCATTGAAACVSVSEVEKSPYWMFRLDPAGRMQPLLSGSDLPDRRQDAPPIFALNGAVYVARSAHLSAGGDFLAPDALAWIMPAHRSVDIDTEFDLAFVEQLIRREGL